MAKAKGEQLDLIEVEHELAKPIIRAAKAYKSAQGAKNEALAEEVKQKTKLLSLVKDAKLKPDEDGIYRFRANSVVITVTPRDELVRVRLEDGDEDAE